MLTADSVLSVDCCVVQGDRTYRAAPVRPLRLPETFVRVLKLLPAISTPGQTYHAPNHPENRL